MFCNPFQVSLVVRYDRQLTFAEHVRKLCQSMSGRFNLLRDLGGTTRRWHTPDCRQVYIVTMRSILENAAAVWEPWMSATSPSKFEKVQLEAARAITGHVRSTPVEAVLADSQLPPISTRFQTISPQKADEWANLPAADYRRQTLFTACKQNLKRNDWRNAQFICLNQLGLNPQVLTPTPPSYKQLSIPPWDRPPSIPTVDKIMSPSQQRDLSLQTIASIPPANFRIFTDNSVSDGIKDGGAGLLVLSQDDLVQEWHAPTGTHRSSFHAEKTTLKEAILILIMGLSYHHLRLQIIGSGCQQH